MTTTDVIRVVHPDTGELLEHLDQQPPEVLADTLAAIRQRQADLKAMSQAVDTELRRRLAIRGRRQIIYGDWELRLEPRRESAWDAEELEQTLRDLVDDGTVNAGELTGIIRRETTVSRTEANRLLTRLAGSARDAVARCRVWRDKGSPQLVVERSVALPTPDQKELPW